MKEEKKNPITNMVSYFHDTVYARYGAHYPRSRAFSGEVAKRLDELLFIMHAEIGKALKGDVQDSTATFPDIEIELTSEPKPDHASDSEPKPEPAPEPEPKTKTRARKKAQPKEKPKAQPKEEKVEPVRPELEHIEFGNGLVPNLPSLKSLEHSDEDLVRMNIFPVILANSIKKIGNHPFFKGSASYIWYLPEDRRRFYLTGMFESGEYQEFTDVCSVKHLDDYSSEGVDIDFVMAAMHEDRMKGPRKIKDLDSTLIADNPAVVNQLKSDKAKTMIAGILQRIDPDHGQKLLDFMLRLGRRKEVISDLMYIADQHSSDDTKNPFVGY